MDSIYAQPISSIRVDIIRLCLLYLRVWTNANPIDQMLCYLQLPETVDSVLRRAASEYGNNSAAELLIDFVHLKVWLCSTVV